jgi:hypothetical protein
MLSTPTPQRTTPLQRPRASRARAELDVVEDEQGVGVGGPADDVGLVVGLQEAQFGDRVEHGAFDAGVGEVIGDDDQGTGAHREVSAAGRAAGGAGVGAEGTCFLRGRGRFGPSAYLGPAPARIEGN